MAEGKITEDKVIVEDATAAKEFFESGWYGNLNNDKLELAFAEALLLQERGRLDIIREGKKMKFADFYHSCSRNKRFASLYSVYKDLRERGLPVRIGFKGSDFRVYERGAKPEKAENVKWIVFVAGEDYPCGLDILERATKLAQNIRTVALWAIVDNDSDVTYYVLNEIAP